MSHVANIIINHLKVAADLTDYIVTVNLADLPSSFWNVVSNGGGDIRCYKDDGTTQLPREVVSCNTSTDTGLLFIKYSGTLSSSTDTIIRIYADGSSSEPAVTDTYGRNSVWTAYEAVWHGGSTTDSTGNGYTLTEVGTVNTTTNTGPFGSGAWEFDGNTANYLYCSPPATGTPFTTSLWVNPDSLVGNHVPFDLHYITSTQQSHRIRVSGDVTGDPITAVTRSGATVGQCNTTTSYSAQAWNYAVGIFASATQRSIYLDAGSSASNTTSVTPTAADRMTLGVGLNPSFALAGCTGDVSEVRFVSDSSLYTTNWITTEFNNQDSTSSFYEATSLDTLYTVVYSSSLSTPSIFQILNGLDVNGDSAVYSSNQTAASSNTYTFYPTGLSPSTGYKAAFWHTGADPTDIEVTAEFTTQSASVDVDLVGQATTSTATQRVGTISADLKLVGQATTSTATQRVGTISADLKLVGQATTSTATQRVGTISADLKLVGQATTSTATQRVGTISADLKLVGQATTSTATQQQGSLNTTTTVDIILVGQATTSTATQHVGTISADLKLVGQATTSTATQRVGTISADLKLVGQATTSTATQQEGILYTTVIPQLSNPTTINITSTSARVGCTITFS